MSFKCHKFVNEIMKQIPKSDSQELPEKYKCHYQIYISTKVNIHRVFNKL